MQKVIQSRGTDTSAVSRCLPTPLSSRFGTPVLRSLGPCAFREASQPSSHPCGRGKLTAPSSRERRSVAHATGHIMKVILHTLCAQSSNSRITRHIVVPLSRERDSRHSSWIRSL